MSKEFEYDECGNIKKEVRECKHFHQDPYWTPNNYDLYFDYNKIPVNIEVENSNDLLRRLQKNMPLSKIIHLNMEDESVPYYEEFDILTKTKIIFNKNVNGKEEKVMVDLR